MADSMHATLLKIFARLPRRGQVAVVHTVSPLYSLGALAVVRNEVGQVLLVRHAYKERWGLPGGISKRGEEPADAARRETFEETGLRVELFGEPIVDISVAWRKVDVIYAARLAVGATDADVRAKPPEILECRWFDLDALPPLQDEAVSGLTRLGFTSEIES